MLGEQSLYIKGTWVLKCQMTKLAISYLGNVDYKFLQASVNKVPGVINTLKENLT